MKKSKTIYKEIIFWLSQRSAVVITVLIFAVGILLIYYVISGFTPTGEYLAIGLSTITIFFAAISAIANLLQAVETQKQRESQERPYIVAYFEGSSSGTINFIIKNAGNSPAENVTIEFDPSPIDFANRELGQVSLFSNPISFLPPGLDIRQIIDSGHRFLGEGKPTEFSVTVRYYSIYGKRFNETVDHDLEYLKQTTLPGKSAEDYLKEISKHVKSFDQSFKSISRHNALLIEPLSHQRARLEKIRKQKPEKSNWKTYVRSMLDWLLSMLD